MGAKHSRCQLGKAGQSPEVGQKLVPRAVSETSEDASRDRPSPRLPALSWAPLARLLRRFRTVAIRLGWADQEWPYPIRADDTYLVSYPRSGNGWMSQVITALLLPDVPPAKRPFQVPDPYALPLQAWRQRPGPLTIKSHSPTDPGFPRVIYLVRDGRDALTSFYDFSIRTAIFDGTFESFVRRRLSVRGEAYGPWPAHVREWALKATARERLVVRYEDLYVNPVPYVSAIARFIGASSDATHIERALECVGNQFAQARRLSPRPLFVGLGQGPGLWKTRFSGPLEDFFWNKAGSVMSELGYPRGRLAGTQ